MLYRVVIMMPDRRDIRDLPHTAFGERTARPPMTKAGDCRSSHFPKTWGHVSPRQLNFTNTFQHFSPMQHNPFFASFLSVLLILVLTGCGNRDSRYSRVEGTVTYNGQPVEGGTVNFQPILPEGESASGITDAGGKFTLTSVNAINGGRGALPGDYNVVLSKVEPPPPDPDQAAFDRGEIDYNELQNRLNRKGPGARGPSGKSLLPLKYSNPGGASGLTATVKRGKNEPFVFELVD
jgi:hypothetical protein